MSSYFETSTQRRRRRALTNFTFGMLAGMGLFIVCWKVDQSRQTDAARLSAMVMAEFVQCEAVL